MLNKKPNAEQKSTSTGEHKEKHERKAYARRFKIAGISHRCTAKDIGIIMGKVAYEPTNQYDPNAIAVIANPEQPNEKLLGYIAKDDQATFKNFAYNEDELPFIGFIEKFDNGNGKAIFGKIKVYNGSEEDMMADMDEDMKSLTRAFSINDYDIRIIELDEW